MAIKRSFIPVGLAMIVIVTALVCPMSRAADNMGAKPEERAVTYKRMGIGDYQNFLKNWDEKKHAVLYALIQTPAQYDALFHPAPLMRDKRPFAPEAEIYTKEQILVVARVMVAPENMDKVGLHPSSWTKYVRVVGRIEHPGKREKGSCHEATKKIQHRAQTSGC